MNSILTSVKRLLGITEEYKHFDPEIIIHINSVFMVLNQIGVGPSEGFMIEDENAKWSDFIAEPATLEAVKTYVGLRVKLVFDPPLSSAVMESMNRTIAELEWRLNVAADSSEEEVIQNGE